MTASETESTRDAPWFLISETNEPLGQVYRAKGEAIPVVGQRLGPGARRRNAQIVEFEDLPQTCEIRRFRVVIRTIE